MINASNDMNNDTANSDTKLSQAVNTLFDNLSTKIAEKISESKNTGNYDPTMAVNDQAETAAKNGGKRKTRNFRLVKKRKTRKNVKK
jgi:hypothetical protein